MDPASRGSTLEERGLNGSTHLIAPEAWEGCNPSGSGAGGKEEVNTELHGNKKKRRSTIELAEREQGR